MSVPKPGYKPVQPTFVPVNWNSEFKTESERFVGLPKVRKDGSPYFLYELNGNFIPSLKKDKDAHPSQGLGLQSCHISAERQRKTIPTFKQDNNSCHMTLEFYETSNNFFVGRVHIYLDHSGNENGIQAHYENVGSGVLDNEGHSIHIIDSQWGFIESLINEDKLVEKLQLFYKSCHPKFDSKANADEANLVLLQGFSPNPSPSPCPSPSPSPPHRRSSCGPGPTNVFAKPKLQGIVDLHTRRDSFGLVVQDKTSPGHSRRFSAVSVVNQSHLSLQSGLLRQRDLTPPPFPTASPLLTPRYGLSLSMARRSPGLGSGDLQSNGSSIESDGQTSGRSSASFSDNSTRPGSPFRSITMDATSPGLGPTANPSLHQLPSPDLGPSALLPGQKPISFSIKRVK